MALAKLIWLLSHEYGVFLGCELKVSFITFVVHKQWNKGLASYDWHKSYLSHFLSLCQWFFILCLWTSTCGWFKMCTLLTQTPLKEKKEKEKKKNPEPYRHYMNINENKIWSRNPLRSSKRSPGASAVGAVSLCLFYFFSSTVLPKYSFWNCWNSSSVNKDFASLAFFTGLSGWFLDCLPLLWFTIYVRQKSNQHVRATCRQQKQFISSQWWLWIYLGYQ